MVRLRFGIILLALLSLASASLDLFAIIFRDRSWGNDTTVPDRNQAKDFLALQRSIVYIAFNSAIVSMLFAVFSLVTATKLTWLGKYSVCQIIRGIMLVSIGGYVAERVRGCEAEFGRLSADGNVPYYSVIYYGYVAQAAYGFVLIILSLAFAAIHPLCEDTRASRLRNSGSC
ncbi:hypothetical protein F5883DRAFT_433922 [Diaporthe sp. PMI_573]|nr:hypothetical protein F5883DRAFT_433922 [Diaporthaceae sp. PMI_573]